MSSSLVFYELNEVPLKVIQRFARERPSSFLAQALRDGRIIDTKAPDSGHLSPWITWPTVHRGVSNDQHDITDFNQDLTDVNRRYPPVWEILKRRNKRVGVFGSLHSASVPEDMSGYSFYFPDSFAEHTIAHPKELGLFQAFNLRMSRRSGRNVSRSLSAADVRDFAKSVAHLGIRGKTLLKTTGHLLSEQFKPMRKVRRRTFQTVLGFDVFYRQLVQKRPEIAFFFTNHVASSMHRYWPALFPEQYEAGLFDDEWRNTFQDEILWALGIADEELRMLSEHVDSTGGALLFASSMGQDAVEVKAVLRTQLLLTDLAKFFSHFGVAAGSVQRLPAMEPVVIVRLDQPIAAAVKARMDGVTVAEKPVQVDVLDESRLRLYFDHQNLPDTVRIVIDGKALPLEQAGLSSVVIEDRSSTYAYHVPGGILGYHGKISLPRSAHDTPVDTREIAPAILRHFGIAPPPYMIQNGLSFDGDSRDTAAIPKTREFEPAAL